LIIIFEIMNDFPELTTAKLTLRKIKPEDLSSLLKHCNNEKISDQILNIPYPYKEEDAIFRMNFVLQGFKNKERYVFAITLKGNDELIGEIGLHLDKNNDSAQFGYWLGEPFWGKGIATEALGVILKFGFETLHLNKIYATHYPDNIASGKIMLNNKMIKEAELKEHYKVLSLYRDVIQYRLTKKEYEELNKMQK
jgi:ribosomal-protein-alanine N-acetyltransferase